MTAFSTGVTRISDFVTAIAKVNDTIAARLHVIEERIAALQGQWHGAAAEQHLTNARVWNQAMQQMRNELSDLQTAVDTARSAYEHTATQNLRTWP